MSFEDHLFKQIVDFIGWRVQIGVDFIQDDFLLLGQLVFGEGGAECDVGKEVETALVVLFEEGGLKAGLFFGGEGVEITTHIIQAAQDVVGFAVLRAFEDGVLHEVSKAVFLWQLIACASLHHQHEVGNLALFLFMYQPDAVRKDGFGVFVFQHRVKIGLQRYNKRENICKFAV